MEAGRRPAIQTKILPMGRTSYPVQEVRRHALKTPPQRQSGKWRRYWAAEELMKRAPEQKQRDVAVARKATAGIANASKEDGEVMGITDGGEHCLLAEGFFMAAKADGDSGEDYMRHGRNIEGELVKIAFTAHVGVENAVAVGKVSVVTFGAAQIDYDEGKMARDVVEANFHDETGGSTE